MTTTDAPPPFKPAYTPSSLPFSTGLRFAKDSLLTKLNKGEKSAEQLQEERLEAERKAIRQTRRDAHQPPSSFGNQVMSGLLGGGVGGAAPPAAAGGGGGGGF